MTTLGNASNVLPARGDGIDLLLFAASQSENGVSGKTVQSENGVSGKTVKRSYQHWTDEEESQLMRFFSENFQEKGNQRRTSLKDFVQTQLNGRHSVGSCYS